jgi:hypothetical protein
LQPFVITVCEGGISSGATGSSIFSVAEYFTASGSFLTAREAKDY